jgi:hypothetical protein
LSLTRTGSDSRISSELFIKYSAQVLSATFRFDDAVAAVTNPQLFNLQLEPAPVEAVSSSLFFISKELLKDNNYRAAVKVLELASRITPPPLNAQYAHEVSLIFYRASLFKKAEQSVNATLKLLRGKSDLPNAKELLAVVYNALGASVEMQHERLDFAERWEGGEVKKLSASNFFIFKMECIYMYNIYKLLNASSILLK